MKKFIFSLFILPIIVIFGCVQNPVEPHPTPIVVGTELCPAVEQHLQSLCNQDNSKNSYCCDIVKPTLKGKSFTQFCIDTQNAGIALNTKCLSEITECSAIDVCTMTTSGK